MTEHDRRVGLRLDGGQVLEFAFDAVVLALWATPVSASAVNQVHRKGRSQRTSERQVTSGSIQPTPGSGHSSLQATERYVKPLPPLDQTDPAERLNADLRRRAQ